MDRLQQLAHAQRYFLRLDIVRHFPAIDHAIVVDRLGRVIRNDGLLDLAERIWLKGNSSGRAIRETLPKAQYAGRKEELTDIRYYVYQR